ncbi:hypothetical protein AGMMS4952_13790 [Spirochaetia bacterium]|nr:hypothetical protein AGMMS4952_13790 [Spirochaetia bacterium]
MKKCISVVCVFFCAVVGLSALEINRGLTISSWGEAGFWPFIKESGGNAGMGIGPSYAEGAAFGLIVYANAGKAGGKFDLRAHPVSGVVMTDSLYAWVQPIDMVKLTVGRWIDYTISSMDSGSLWLDWGAQYQQEVIFKRFIVEEYGAMLSITPPIKGLYAQWQVNAGANTQNWDWSNATPYAASLKSSQAAIVYTKDGLGRVRYQYVGDAEPSKTFSQVSVQFFGMRGLTIDAGLTIPHTFERDEVNEDNVIKAGFNTQFNIGALTINEGFRIEDREDGLYWGLVFTPKWNFGKFTVGGDLGFRMTGDFTEFAIAPTFELPVGLGKLKTGVVYMQAVEYYRVAIPVWWTF